MSFEPADTVGLTITSSSPSGGSAAGSPGPTNVVGTIGTPDFSRELVYDEAASRKYLQTARLDALLGELAARWGTIAEWRKEPLEEALRAVASERGVKAAALIHPVRMALSASTAGPPLFDLVEVMGREEAAQRLGRYRQYLGALPAA